MKKGKKALVADIETLKEFLIKLKRKVEDVRAAFYLENEMARTAPEYEATRVGRVFEEEICSKIEELSSLNTKNVKVIPVTFTALDLYSGADFYINGIPVDVKLDGRKFRQEINTDIKLSVSKVLYNNGECFVVPGIKTHNRYLVETTQYKSKLFQPVISLYFPPMGGVEDIKKGAEQFVKALYNEKNFVQMLERLYREVCSLSLATKISGIILDDVHNHPEFYANTKALNLCLTEYEQYFRFCRRSDLLLQPIPPSQILTGAINPCQELEDRIRLLEEKEAEKSETIEIKTEECSGVGTDISDVETEIESVPEIIEEEEGEEENISELPSVKTEIVSEKRGSFWRKFQKFLAKK